MWTASMRVARSARKISRWSLITTMKDVGGWINGRQGNGESFNSNKSRWSIRRKMRLRRRSSTSGPSKGRGAPQISRGMTRLRVALGDNSRYLRFVLGDASFRTILSILKTVGKYLIGSTIWCGCLLVYYAVLRSDTFFSRLLTSSQLCAALQKRSLRFEGKK